MQRLMWYFHQSVRYNEPLSTRRSPALCTVAGSLAVSSPVSGPVRLSSSGRWGQGRPSTHRYAKYTYATFIRDFRTCELLSRDFHPTIESRSWWIKSV